MKKNLDPIGSSINQLLFVRGKLVGLSNIAFRAHLKYQRSTQGSIFRYVRATLAYSGDTSNRIVDDRVVSRKEFEPFYLYLTYLNFWRRNLENLTKNLSKAESGQDQQNQSKGFKQGLIQRINCPAIYPSIFWHDLASDFHESLR